VNIVSFKRLDRVLTSVFFFSICFPTAPVKLRKKRIKGRESELQNLKFDMNKATYYAGGGSNIAQKPHRYI
jgi:hypothetical protein